MFFYIIKLFQTSQMVIYLSQHANSSSRNKTVRHVTVLASDVSCIPGWQSVYGSDYDFVLIITALYDLLSFAWVKDKPGLRKFRAGQNEDAFGT